MRESTPQRQIDRFLSVRSQIGTAQIQASSKSILFFTVGIPLLVHSSIPWSQPMSVSVLCVDEKPSMQSLERKTGYLITDNGEIVRGLKSTYKRHGTLNLFAALAVATGDILTQTTKQKRRIEFLDFMERIVAEYPLDTELHVILDNYCIHKRNDEWLIKHPNVTFHYTPTSASWLNQVEIWFGIMSRKVIRGASFRDTQELGNRCVCESIQENSQAIHLEKKRS